MTDSTVTDIDTLLAKAPKLVDRLQTIIPAPTERAARDAAVWIEEAADILHDLKNENAELLKSLDANWVQHQRVVRVEAEATRLQESHDRQRSRAISAEAERDALRTQFDSLATIFRINILRIAPQTTHAEIDAAIDAARAKEK